MFEKGIFLSIIAMSALASLTIDTFPNPVATATTKPLATISHQYEIDPTPTVMPVLSPAAINTPQPNRSIKRGMVIENYADPASLATLEQELNTTISTLSFFRHMGLESTKRFPANMQHIPPTKRLLIAWEPWNPEEGMNQSTDYLVNIAQGDMDEYIKEFAKDAQTYGKPITIRFAHEMNGNWYPWGNRPLEYIAAHQRIVDIFKNLQVNNVLFMWCVNHLSLPVTATENLSHYYPGNAYVDVIGIDGFNFGGASWRSFSDIFLPSYTFLKQAYTKPMVIAETASSESGGSKANWIKNMNASLPLEFSTISEVIWFNLNKEADWRFNSSPESQQEFIKDL